MCTIGYTVRNTKHDINNLFTGGEHYAINKKNNRCRKKKRETGSIDKVRINDDSVQVLTSEGKIYVFDKQDVYTVTNISLSVNERPVNVSFENSGYGTSTNAIRFQRYPIVEFVNLAPETVKNYMKSILMESVLDLSDVKVIHSYKWGTMSRISICQMIGTMEEYMLN